MAVEAAKQRLAREAAARTAREAMRTGVIEGGKAAAERGGARVVVEGASQLAPVLRVAGPVLAWAQVAYDVGRVVLAAVATNQAVSELEESTLAETRAWRLALEARKKGLIVQEGEDLGERLAEERRREDARTAGVELGETTTRSN